jgi:hypothetical protein
VEPTDEEELASLLRRTAPRPREAFVRDLETSLLRSVAPARTRRLPRLGMSRRLVAASACGAAVCALLGVLSVAGALPLGLGGANDAAAGRECVTVTRWTLTQRPVFRVGTDGRMHMHEVASLVPRHVVRCH